jgi:hypothetical protein
LPTATSAPSSTSWATTAKSSDSIGAFGALLGGTRKELEQRIREGFPYLPAGCHMELDPIASEIVLRSIREREACLQAGESLASGQAVPSTWPAKVAELRRIAQGRESVSLAQYLEETGFDLDDVYSNGRSWSDLRADAGLPLLASGPKEQNLRRACGHLLHVDDMERIETYRRFLAADSLPPCKSSRPHRHCEEPIEMDATKQSRGVPGRSPSATPAKALMYPLRKRRTPCDGENSIPPESCWEDEDTATGWTLHHAHRVPNMSE